MSPQTPQHPDHGSMVGFRRQHRCQTLCFRGDTGADRLHGCRGGGAWPFWQIPVPGPASRGLARRAYYPKGKEQRIQNARHGAMKDFGGSLTCDTASAKHRIAIWDGLAENTAGRTATDMIGRLKARATRRIAAMACRRSRLHGSGRERQVNVARQMQSVKLLANCWPAHFDRPAGDLLQIAITGPPRHQSLSSHGPEHERFRSATVAWQGKLRRCFQVQAQIRRFGVRATRNATNRPFLCHQGLISQNRARDQIIRQAQALVPRRGVLMNASAARRYAVKEVNIRKLSPRER